MNIYMPVYGNDDLENERRSVVAAFEAMHNRLNSKRRGLVLSGRGGFGGENCVDFLPEMVEARAVFVSTRRHLESSSRDIVKRMVQNMNKNGGVEDDDAEDRAWASYNRYHDR